MLFGLVVVEKEDERKERTRNLAYHADADHAIRISSLLTTMASRNQRGFLISLQKV